METKEEKKLLPLEKHSGIYKLVIPADVEKKIRHLCNVVSQVEWSGTLFYTHSGSFEEGNLELRCVDIFPMDIGSAAYTEFDMSPDVIAYMTDHPELLDCQMGLIHSHNNMATFFSGTDTATLREEGNDRNHFVSLIVNNAGTYTAAITRRLNIKKVVHTTYTYRTFDDLEKVGEGNVEVEEEVLGYNMLNIIKEGEPHEPFLEIDERLKAIRENKKKAATVVKQPLSTSPYIPPRQAARKEEKPKYVQPTLFDEEYMESEPPRQVERVEESLDISISAPLVKQLTLQLITGSIAISDTSKIEPAKWAKQMDNLFDKRFDRDMSKFNLWAETFAEFILMNFIPEEYEHYEDVYVSELSTAIYCTLDKLPQNKYIKALKDAVTLWIIQ